MIGLVYGVMSGVAVPLLDPTPAEWAFEKLHLQVSQWLMMVGGCLSAGVFCVVLGKEIIRQLLGSKLSYEQYLYFDDSFLPDHLVFC